MIFRSPWILSLFVLLPFVFALNRRRPLPAFRFSSLAFTGYPRAGWRLRLFPCLFFLRFAAAALVIVALAGPRRILKEVNIPSEGIDIVLAIDASGSMAAEDFRLNGQRYNRLTVVKDVVQDFIVQRRSDRLALVAFAGRAYTVCPLTTDYTWLEKNLERIDLGIIEDGTAVGSAIASSLSRLENSRAKSRVIILLTDGVNNAGKIDPVTAAKTAAALGVKIYTIGAGTKGPVPFPVKDPWGRTVYRRVQIELDEKALKEIARLTEGEYFVATDTESLRRVYQEIDAMEKTLIEKSGYKEYEELFPYFLFPAMGMLLLEIILSRTVFLRIP